MQKIPYKQLPYAGQCRVTKLYHTLPPPGMTYSAGLHAGIDIVGEGSKKIFPIVEGEIFKIGNSRNGWGQYVVVEQEDGYFAIYAHLKKIEVRKGQVIFPFECLGVEGATGNVTGAHLHLEIRKNYADKNSTLDPAEYLGIKNKLGVVEMKEQEQVVSSWAAADWNWAKEKGLLDGTRPKDPITREEMAAILHRLCTMS